MPADRNPRRQSSPTSAAGDRGTREQLLRIPEAAQSLGVSIRSVYKLISTGALPTVSLPGLGVQRVRRSDIERMMHAGVSLGGAPRDTRPPAIM